MNSDIDGKKTICIDVFEEIYVKLRDTDREKRATWNEERLDYALVSKIMQNSVETIPIETKSGHKGLRTVFCMEG